MQILAAEHDVRGMDLPELDITDAESIASGFDGWPEAIVNCAAYTNVDGCESEQDAAWAVNAEGPRHLAEYANRHGAFLVHVSTDYVFDGTRPVPNPYREDDPTGPVSFYGKSKLAGEKAIQESGCAFAIARTSWLYGAQGRNLLKKTMLRLALKKSLTAIKVVDDQYGCPTWSYRLAQQIRRIVATRATGIFHASGEGFCTWFELAVHFLWRTT